MILDSGICTIFRKANTAEPGRKPVWGYRLIHRGWYGELNFETAPARPTEAREEVHTDARIRIYQNRSIANHDVAVLRDADAVEPGDTVYTVTRVYHGADDESAALISDLSLEVTAP